ncbi:MAG: hypothetical protein WCR29_07290 [Bacteroidales bacterium]|nr:hypothetical protein [Bacteroidales bacterium]
MAFNLIKKYPELLEINHYRRDNDRDIILRKIFDRDIQENDKLIYNSKQIHPIKDTDGISSLEVLFDHLTREKTEEIDSNGKRIACRNVFEPDRSMRIHWIKTHLDNEIKDGIVVFSIIERDKKKREDITRTYIYNTAKKYVVILENQRSNIDYYLLTAYYLNKTYGEKDIKRKMKNCLPCIV